MYAIFKKEITLFFSSLIAYIAIGVFLLLTGLFLWVLPGNIFEEGFAGLDQFFDYAPRVLMLLIPAITMRSFAEEKKTGTIEILSTKPVTDMQIILGKFFAGLVLVLFSLIPTFFFYYTVYQLADPTGNMDTGATWGSYIGLFFAGGAYLAIGIFASAITDNQIVAFIVGLFMCFFFYMMLNYLPGIEVFRHFDWLFEAFSIQSHYISISRGIVDTRDIVFFISFITAFLFLTKMNIQRRRW
jgi:ABC-2 type transport system permease protein